MNGRERVIAAIEHREPDRVPLDLGGSFVTSIHAQALAQLRRELGLEDRPVKLHDAVQMLGEVEMDVVAALDLDVLPIEPLNLRVAARSDRHRVWDLFGIEILVPEDFDVEQDEEGGWLLFAGVGESRRPTMHMPADGFYFDTIDYGAWDPDFTPPPLERIREASKHWHLAPERLEYLGSRADELRRTTDKALMLNPWGGLGMHYVGRLTEFLCLLAEDPGYVRELFSICVEVALANLERLWDVVGENADLIFITGLDFGSQRAELFSPETFREVYLPALKAHYDWIHENTTWKCFEHSCGSIGRIVEDMADAGLDVLNPIQTTAAGMDPASLKRRVGEQICFWGGGVETQGTLQFGTPEEVREEVAERVRIFGAGGGFVFCPDHNIQPNTPPENIVAAYTTARESGQYPVAQ
ncbi:MAG: uroporphyrinogen decarboxylase family protein [Armatimonadota bacterium]